MNFKDYFPIWNKLNDDQRERLLRVTECKKAKALFYENLGTMTIVEIQEDIVSGDQACSFLKMLAKDN